jgi:hypothetical protein
MIDISFSQNTFYFIYSVRQRGAPDAALMLLI